MSTITVFQREALAAPLIWIPLRTAYLCDVCKAIFSGAPKGVCRGCGSHTIRAVSSFLQSPDERRAWLIRVNDGMQTWVDDAIEEVPIG